MTRFRRPILTVVVALVVAVAVIGLQASDQLKHRPVAAAAHPIAAAPRASAPATTTPPTTTPPTTTPPTTTPPTTTPPARTVATISAASTAGVTIQATDVTGAGATSPTEGSLPLSAIEAEAPKADFTTVQLVVAHELRSYLVISPDTGAAHLPAIVVLSGSNASITQEVGRDELLPLVENAQAVLVYPVAYRQSWNADAANCCGPAVTQKLHDAAFVSAVVTDVQSRFDVNKEATYLLGFSNGGKLAYEVACQSARLFAAVAVADAVPLASCSSSSRLSVMITVGSADPELPTAEHPEAASAALDGATASWRSRDKCTDASSTTTIGSATLTTWPNCAGSTEVTSVTYAGIGHTWVPEYKVGPAEAESTLTWQFFTAHRGRA